MIESLVNSLKKPLLAGILVLLVVGCAGSILYLSQQPMSSENVQDIDTAAKKADALQSAELQASITALERNDGGKIIWGDRFLRWTVLAYTIWRLDQGDQRIVPEMEKLLVLYYNHAWYPYVKNKPHMPFPSLIQYFHADGTWEDYWNDYKPVYASAFVLEYYLLSCYDRDWGTQNFSLMKNVTDSIVQMWLSARHQPTGYVDAFKAGAVEVVEVKNITSSVDSAMVDSALIAAAQIAKTLGNDRSSAETYESYATDSLSHFTSENWDWFPTSILGSDLGNDYGTALQLGMTIPNIDADDKIDAYAQIVNSSLRLGRDSWLLRWAPADTEPSSRSVYAAIGLAPKFPEMALNILISYAHKALQEDPWFTSKTDGYEAADPIWVSGKFLEAYVLFKQRLLFGRTIFSPSVLQGELRFQTSLGPQPFQLQSFNFTFPTLYGSAISSAQVLPDRFVIILQGFVGRNVTLTFLHGLANIRLEPADVPRATRVDVAAHSVSVAFTPDSRPVTIYVN
jgi:hypothetical protein